MKNILILFLTGIIIFGCSNDDDNDPNIGNCDFETIINADQYLNAPSHPIAINSLEIEEDCLSINFGSSGCDGDSWEIKLIDSGNIMESYPPQRNLRLSLKNEEVCHANITKEVTFDISNLKIGGNKVLLNISNSGEGILYEY